MKLNGGWPLALLAALALFSVVPPVTAQGGLTAAVVPACVFTGPGANLVLPVSVSSTPSHEQVTLTLVGSGPPGSNVSLSRNSGFTPLAVNVSVQIIAADQSLGSFQLGVLAKSGEQARMTMFTIHVIRAGGNSTQADACQQVGLPIPTSTLVVAGTSIGLGLTTQVATRLLVDLKTERKMKTEVAAFNKEKRGATLAKDAARLDKLKKRDPQIKQLQAKISTARLKVLPITFLPLLAFYYLMTPFLGGYNVIVALSPISIPYFTESTGVMVMFWWYLICSFVFSSALAKLFRTTT